MEYLLDNNEHKKLKVSISPTQVLMEFTGIWGSFSFHPTACQKLMEIKDSITENFYLIKNDVNVSFVQRLHNSLFVVVESPFLCVQLRSFNPVEGIYTPSVEGISLKENQWIELIEILSSLFDTYPIFHAPNMCGLLHSNQEDINYCYNCRCDFEEEYFNPEESESDTESEVKNKDTDW